MWLKRVVTPFVFCIVLMSACCVAAADWVSISGTVLYNGNPICGLVLANGQHMFSCDENIGTYNLSVPLDDNGEITLFGFVSGLAPFQQTLTPAEAADFTINMSAEPSENILSVNYTIVPSGTEGWVTLSGTVDWNGTPVCGLVLANGQHMFSCDANEGIFNLEVPLDESNEIVLFSFASGFEPYRETIDGSGVVEPPVDNGEVNVNPPASPVKLIFIHHSTGGNWLADANEDSPYGGLGTALMNNNYYVSATNYGWGPDSIGDNTDLIYWPDWFTGTNSATYLAALYAESSRNVGDFGSWQRLASDPGGENEIIMFKSCFPNSNLYGNPDDAALSAPDPSAWGSYTVENVKAVYNNILTYFADHQEKLFIVITAPPLLSSETAADRAANARAFNNWLVNDWLDNYQYDNVGVFDYFTVLTDPDNHHRVVSGAVQHETSHGDNYSYYPVDSYDSHPSTAGHSKATQEFGPLLNYYYNLWQQ